MRINFVLRRASLNGGSRVVAIYADHLRNKGHEVRIISRQRRGYSAGDRIRALLKGKLLPAHPPHGPCHFDGLDLDWRIAQHHRPLTEADIPEADITIATWWETAEWVNALGPARGRKIYFCQHYEAHEGQPVDRVNASYRLPLEQICVSEWVRDQVRREAGHDHQIIVPNAVDAAVFATPERGKQQKPTVGFMYNPAPYKGTDITIAALRRAKSAVPELHAICFSARPPVERLALPDWVRVEISPPQARIAEIYASCDAWLFASRREGFGLPVLEAMASRTPVIATPAGAAPELVAENRGILIPHDDPDAMAEAITRVASMGDAEWRALSGRAHAATASLSWTDAAGRFESALLRSADSDEPVETTGRAAP